MEAPTAEPETLKQPAREIPLPKTAAPRAENTCSAEPPANRDPRTLSALPTRINDLNESELPKEHEPRADIVSATRRVP
jgi:hypothetical protein